ncbi:MAG: hypothetical protein HYT94_05565 [Parcubacteria group bacterium]|nr:hypothetical protein [Parcubacteria group bacterium]
MENLLTKNLLVPLLLAVILALPFVLWVTGHHKFAGFIGLYVLFTIPSIIAVIRMAIKDGAWPKIVGGPSITLGKKRIGF